ncbi:uncharacterized protein LOC143192593 isoform X1 [Rhynchophorus ferrugineus]|uniref:uncharacterized protein LOC143192593 isoform X1 n=1 Tax=Rhynchophorus ferrugineus TaxID=354439 RepID=UPI003FCC8E10
MSVGDMLLDDSWFIQNTLPYVFMWLNAQDLLSCSMVCKSWNALALETRFWQSAKFENCLLNFNDMAEFLCKQKTCHLNLVNCLYMLNKNLIEALKTLKNLTTLELSAATLNLIEQLPEINSNLHIIRANVICGVVGSNLNLDFLKRLPRLYELKLHCDRQLTGEFEYLNYCRNLRHLCLVGVKNLKSMNISESEATGCERLKSLALGDCFQLPNTFGELFIKKFSNLEHLRLENCRDSHIASILYSISDLKLLRTLELIEINADKNFSESLGYCTQITDLVVVPNLHRYHMATYNHRIFLGVVSLRDNLKHFTWGFSPKYLSYVNKVLEQENSIPFQCELLDPINTNIFVAIDNMNLLLKQKMKNTCVKIECKEYTGDVFL